MIDPLPLRVRFQPGEPADSLLARLATRWRMSFDDFRAFVGISGADMRQGNHAERLALLAGFDPAAVLAATPTRTSGSRRMHVGSAWTDVSDMCGLERRLCPECVEEDRVVARAFAHPEHLAAWSRREWTVRSILTCVRHGLLLDDSCGLCGVRFDAGRPAIDRCVCGADPRCASRRFFGSEVDVLLCDMIAGRTVSPMFRDVGLHQISSHLLRLGQMTLGWSSNRPAATGIAAFEVRETGLRLALAGDEHLTARLDEIVAAAVPGASRKQGLMSGYGWIWRSWLGVPGTNPLDAELRARLRQHAQVNGLSAPDRDDGVTLEGARRVLGESRKQSFCNNTKGMLRSI